MAILTNQEKTLTEGQFTLLHRARREKCRLTLTGISGEFTTIPFKKKIFGALTTGPFEAREVLLRFFQAFPSGQILASTPPGVATLDIVYEVRTGTDA